MTDQGVEISVGVNPVAVSGENQKPIDVEQAKDCVRQLREIARKQGTSFGLAELRKTSIDNLLSPGDSDKGEEPGLLRKAGWQDDEQTRKFLENGQRYAEDQAEEWIKKIQSELGLTPEQLSEKSFDELIRLAKDKGWSVEVIPNDPKQEEVEETLDYLRNAWEKANEKAIAGSETKEGAASELAEETEAGLEVIDDLGKILDGAGEVIFNLVANGVNNPQVYIQQGERLVNEILGERGNIDNFLASEGDLSDNQKAQFEAQKRILALGYDLQIAGLNEKLAKVKNQKERDVLEAQLNKLKEERQKLKTKDKSGNEVEIPDQVEFFAQQFNCENLSQVRVLFEQAAGNPKVKKELLEYIENNLGLGNNKQVVEEILNKIHNRQLKTWEKRGRIVGSLALVLVLLLAWRASQADKQRGGG